MNITDITKSCQGIIRFTATLTLPPAPGRGCVWRSESARRRGTRRRSPAFLPLDIREHGGIIGDRHGADILARTTRPLRVGDLGFHAVLSST